MLKVNDHRDTSWTFLNEFNLHVVVVFFFNKPSFFSSSFSSNRAASPLFMFITAFCDCFFCLNAARGPFTVDNFIMKCNELCKHQIAASIVDYRNQQPEYCFSVNFFHFIARHRVEKLVLYFLWSINKA